jgi:nitrate/TMAO reductase-like tetraheme cytochrome c subunit
MIMSPLIGVIAALFQQGTAGPDSLRADSIDVASPLPSPALQVVRFLFNTVPQWVQIGGVFLAAAVAIVLAVLGWRNRVALRAWFTGKSRAWKMGFAAMVLVMAGAVGFAGTWSWNYMMHTNEFCSGCHIMAVPFQRFGTSEHAKLGCHDCHRQSIFASMKELYIQVTERPENIPEHRSVPNAICSECHIQRDPDSTWQRISATAGHQVHLNPRSPVMSKVECTTCHGQEVHRFKPVSETCAQSGCHDDVKVELGKMAQQTDLHCVVCHEFTVRATEGNPIDSSRAALTPGDQQCLGCHAMRERLGAFAPDSEPHGAKCGSCHNPHVQTTPRGAFESCATSGCHSRSDTLTAMHRNLGRHRLETCGACHGAHTWKANAVDCRSCHTGIRDPAVRTRPPDHPSVDSSGMLPRLPSARPQGESAPSPHRLRLPFLLMPAAWSGNRQAAMSLSLPVRAARVRWPTAPAAPSVPPARQSTPSQRRDTARFEHARHDALSCTTCHSTRAGHGDLKVSVARDCQGCHHGNTAVGRNCASCHTAAELVAPRARVVSFALSVWPQPRTRQLPFAHDRHAPLECAACHTASRQQTVQRDCASCHDDHHSADRDCASCHPPSRATHTRALHLSGCGTAGCHDRERGPGVSPVRSTCLVCHAEQKDHKTKRECAGCHLSEWNRAVGGGP